MKDCSITIEAARGYIGHVIAGRPGTEVHSHVFQAAKQPVSRISILRKVLRSNVSGAIVSVRISVQ